jgi:exosortase/archaeosortase family protein
VTDLAARGPALPVAADIGRPVVAALTSPRYTVQRRALLAIGLVAVAFHYSLSTLVRTLGDQTPLAYLGLVPVIALLLAAASIRPSVGEPPIHDRQVDYIIGVPMLLGALTFNILMPVRMSTLFWLYRMDLVALPLFVAGTITLLFGVRTLWRLRIPVGFLILAWPLPYTTMLLDSLSSFTNSTLSALNVLLHVDHVAAPSPAQGQGIYTVTHAGHTFSVSVASACSGVNGVVGYLLIGIAFLAIVKGGWAPKLIWLALGLIGVWMSNVARIFLILFAGAHWGQHFAIEVLHPFIGLLMFNLTVAAMVVLMSRFPLHIEVSPRDAVVSTSAHVRQAVPKAKAAVAVLVALALLGYLADSALRSYDLVLNSLGAPRLVSFSDSPSKPKGWSVVKTNIYTWATPFFGDDSTWYRYSYYFGGDTSAPLRSTANVVSDVINTSDLNSFSTYGIEACYRFHGYKLHSIRTVDLGGGVAGNVLAYYNPSTRSDWTTVYWHWPVKTASGKTRYERITLMLLNTGNVSFSGPPPQPSLVRSLGFSINDAISGKSSAVDARFNQTETFLVEFARAIIQQQAVVSGSAKPAVHAVAAGTQPRRQG